MNKNKHRKLKRYSLKQPTAPGKVDCSKTWIGSKYGEAKDRGTVNPGAHERAGRTTEWLDWIK